MPILALFFRCSRPIPPISPHYVSRAFSVDQVLSTKPSVLSDATRILTLAGLAALADAVARRAAFDAPSAFCLQYSGAASGPAGPFTFTLDALEPESATMRMHDASLLGARTRLLDYFASTRALLLPLGGGAPDASDADASPDASRLCFRFEESMRWAGGDATLVDQLAYRLGYPAHGWPEAEGRPAEEARAAASPAPWRYFTGEAAEMGSGRSSFKVGPNYSTIILYFAGEAAKMESNRNWSKEAPKYNAPRY